MSAADTMPSEQAADLAAIKAAASEQPAPAGQVEQGEAGQGAEPAPPSAGSVQAATMLVGILRPLLGFALKSLKDAPDELWEPLPAGVAGVLDHYSVDGAEWLRNPWVRLAFCGAPLAAYVVAEEMKAKPAPAIAAPGQGQHLAAPAPTEAPGARTVTIGAVQAVGA
jgi:hypothetical protein